MKKILLLFLIWTTIKSSYAQIFYVTPSGAGSKDGSSWSNAYEGSKLQDAINTAASYASSNNTTSQVWVAAGTYYPTVDAEGNANPANARHKTFVMKNNVGIYGGFPSTGNPTMSQRNWKTNVTLLSGEIQQDNDISNNVYHVFLNDNNGLNNTAIIDGITISYGAANNIEALYEERGGGMYNYLSSPRISNCTFSFNQSAYFGGGLTTSEATPEIENCTFLSNSSDTGGGICSFGEYDYSIVNCLFISNTANTSGGGIYNGESQPLILNCTLVNNSASINGSGVHNWPNSFPTLKNCILWNSGAAQVGNSGGSSTTYVNCLIKGLNPGGSNLDGTNSDNTPLFVDAANNDFRLLPCSPGVNQGDNSGVLAKDFDGNNRIFGGTVDLGAFELQSTTLLVINVSSSSSPTTCGGSNGNIELSGLLASVAYTINYKKDGNAVSATEYTSDANGIITLSDLSAGNYTDIVATRGVCVSNPVSKQLSDPALPSITLGSIAEICPGGTSFSIPFSNPENAPTSYSLSGTGLTSVTDGALPSSPIMVSLNEPAETGSYSFSLTVKNANNCISTELIGSVVVKAAPVASLLSSNGPLCGKGNAIFEVNGTSGATLNYTLTGLAGTQTLLLNGSNQHISVSDITANTTLTLLNVISNTTPACTTALSSSTTVIVNAAPNSYTLSGDKQICLTSTTGNTPALTLTLWGSQTNATYELQRNGTTIGASVNGTGNSLVFPVQTTVGVYTVVATMNTGGCKLKMDGTPSIGMAPTAFTMTGGGSYCKNGAGVAIGLSGSQVGVKYQLRRSGLNVGSAVAGTGSSISFGNQTAAGSYTVVAIEDVSGCSRNMSGAKTVTINNNCSARESIASWEQEDNITSEDGWAMIAPNPVIGESFQLQVKGQSNQKISLEIMNLQGQIVQQNKFETEAYLHKQLVEVKELKAGVYVLQVMAENRKTTLKLIKAN
jgi:hypothetical protein